MNHYQRQFEGQQGLTEMLQAQCNDMENEISRLRAELENRSNEPEMQASDAYHHCVELIEPHVIDQRQGSECSRQSLTRSVCGSLSYLIAHWLKTR